MGIVALSVLVYDRTGQRPGDRRPLPRAPASCRRCWRRSWSPGSSEPPPRFALPVIYCGEAAAFGGPGAARRPLLPRRPWSLLATIDGAAGAGRPGADPGGRRRDARAGRRAARRQRDPQRRLHRRRRGRARPSPAWSSPASACRRRCCSTPSPSTRSPGSCFTAGPLPRAEPRTGATCANGSGPASPTSREKPPLRRLLIAQGAAFVFFAAVIPVEVDLREGNAGRRRLRLRADAGQLGSRDGPRQLRLRGAAAGARSRTCSSSARSRSASATSASPSPPPWPSPAPPRSSAAPATACSGSP